MYVGMSPSLHLLNPVCCYSCFLFILYYHCSSLSFLSFLLSTGAVSEETKEFGQTYYASPSPHSVHCSHCVSFRWRTVKKYEVSCLHSSFYYIFIKPSQYYTYSKQKSCSCRCYFVSSTRQPTCNFAYLWQMIFCQHHSYFIVHKYKKKFLTLFLRIYLNSYNCCVLPYI